MTDNVKLICQSESHPFKKNWYWFHESDVDIFGEISKKYCTSCASAYNRVFIMIQALAQPSEALYGMALMQLTREQVHKIVDEVYNRMEAKK